MTKRFCATALMALALGCAGRAGPVAESEQVRTASRGSDLITGEELATVALSASDALDAVRRLRPRFLTTHGTVSIRVAGAGTVHVSLNGGALQATSVLSQMRPAEIAEIRYLNATDAAQRFGTNAGSGGVLLVKSR